MATTAGMATAPDCDSAGDRGNDSGGGRPVSRRTPEERQQLLDKMKRCMEMSKQKAEEANKQYMADYGYSRSSSLSIARSPDTSSPIYPERAIRPLPKSRLKSKLSPEQRSSIVYPPDPQPMPPPLNFTVQEPGTLVGRQPNGIARHYQYEEPVHHHHHCTCDHDHGDSGDEEVEFDHPDYRYSTNGAVATNGQAHPAEYEQRTLLEFSRVSSKPPPPGSAASSADGYESFENTSNKKKRKIPLSSASSMHQSQLSAEMANMGISHGDGGGDRDVAYSYHYAPMSSPGGTGISGAGRGRYGRQNSRNERRPLASSTMNTVNFGKRSQGKSDPGPFREDFFGLTQPSTSEEVSNLHPTDGIISQAIKTAAEQGPLTPQKGKENISLLQQSASSSTTPKTQFTFSCESESASKMLDQQAAVAAYGTPTPGARANGHPGPAAKGMMATQGTQTTPSLRGAPPGSNTRPPPPPNNNVPSQSAPPPAPKPKPRRRPSKEYELAARQRKLQQEYQNYHHRPTKDNMWVCEFCEYETIFGEPPLALIRAYEIKDRQERKKAAEKRRLLEKAKMKNRKGKKGGKNKNNNSAAPPPAGAGANGAHYDPNLPPPVDGDDYYDDDEYGDEYDPIGPEDGYPPPPPAVTPLEAQGHGPGVGRPPPPSA